MILEIITKVLVAAAIFAIGYFVGGRDTQRPSDSTPGGE